MKKFKVLKEMKIGNKVIKPGSVITIMEALTTDTKKGPIHIYAVETKNNRLLDTKTLEDCIKPIEIYWHIWLENEGREYEPSIKKQIYKKIYTYIKDVYDGNSGRPFMRNSHGLLSDLAELIEHHDINLVGKTTLDNNRVTLTLSFTSHNKPITDSESKASKVVQACYYSAIYMFLTHWVGNSPASREIMGTLSNFKLDNDGPVYDVIVKNSNDNPTDIFLEWELLKYIREHATKESTHDIPNLKQSDLY